MVYPLSSTQFAPFSRPGGTIALQANAKYRPAFGFAPSAFNLASASANAMGATGPAMMGVRQFMGTLENNFLAQLVVSDLLAMVLPRTAVEMKERGVVAAQETLFRELVGTLTNTILAGWLGYGVAKSMQKNKMNLRAMDTHTWIEANSLEHYGNLARKLVTDKPQATGAEIRKAFYTEALGQLDATDPIAKLPEYQHIFPNKGRLGKSHITEMTKRLVGESHPVDMPYNLEAKIHEQLDSIVEKKALKAHLEGIRKAYYRGLGSKVLDEAQTDMLKSQLSQAEKRWHQSRFNTLRLQHLPHLRQKETELANNLYHYAVNHGKLSDQVFVLKHATPLDDAGQIAKNIGARPLKDQLAAMVHFDREFLTRGLADVKTGSLSGRIDPQAFLRRLFTSEPTGPWAKLLKNLPSKPKTTDGLITLAYRAKLWVVVLPVLFTALAGMLTVTINNWITRNRFHGQKFFPGEQVFMGTPQGGRA